MAQREQLNLRLPPDSFDVLAAAAFYDGVSVPDYVKQLLEHEVARLRKDEDIADTIRRKVVREGAGEATCARGTGS
jgi:hypothetical protein